MILGGGALGAILAAHLHRAGEDVAVVAREPRASVLTRDGIRITGLTEFTAKVPVYTDPSVANDADQDRRAQDPPDSAVVRELRPKQGCGLPFKRRLQERGAVVGLRREQRWGPSHW